MRETIDFLAEDGAVLNGYLMKNTRKNKDVLIEVHGMTSNCFKGREKVIAENALEIGYDTICFNTRGSEIVKCVKYIDGTKKLGGTAYEDIEDSYYDVVGAIKYALSLGYENIILQGHSLGSTKVLYTYSRMQKEQNEMLKNIKGIILLSLVDLPRMIRFGATENLIQLARKNVSENGKDELLYTPSFIQLMSAGTLVKYVDKCENFDFARYSDKNYDFETLNNIDVPLFMRWGDTNELIETSANDLVELLKRKINNPKANIDYIKGANHSYTGKEQILANQIKGFIKEKGEISYGDFDER